MVIQHAVVLDHTSFTLPVTAEEGDYQDAVCAYDYVVANMESLDGCVVLDYHVLTDGYKRLLASILESREETPLYDLALFIDAFSRWSYAHVLFKERILRNDHYTEIAVDAHSLLDNVLNE